MQGLETLVKQNNITAAIQRAQKSGEVHYVVQDSPDRYNITTIDPGEGNAVYVAKPDFPTEL